MLLRAVALILTLVLARPALADDEIAVRASTEPSAKRRTLAVLAAIGPGFVVRGAGSWLVGEKRTAKRLMLGAAGGLGAAAIGGLPVGVSGGNPYTIIPGVPILLAGAGAFLTSWWADIAVAAGANDLEHLPRASAPWSIELGTLWLHDGVRGERGLARLAGRVELGRVGVGAAGMIDATNEQRDGEVETRVRIKGARATGIAVADGSRLYARSALRYHRDDDDRVTLVTGEVELAGRRDLVHVDRALRGTFAELSTGLGVERAAYADTHDYGSLLLGTFVWGVYLGGRGEATVFYDHRRDHLAGGIAAWRAAGFVGSLGASVDILVAPRWAVRGVIEYGSALVTTLALRYEGGQR